MTKLSRNKICFLCLMLAFSMPKATHSVSSPLIPLYVWESVEKIM